MWVGGKKLIVLIISASVTHGLSIVVSFGLSVILARLMSVDDFGRYMFAYTFIGIVTVVGKAGYDQVFLRYFAEYKVKGDIGKLRGLVNFGLAKVFLYSVSIVLVLFLVLSLWGEYFQSNAIDVTVIIYSLGLGLIFPLIKIIQGALRGWGYVFISQSPDNLFRPLMLGVIAALSLQFQYDLSVIDVVVIHTSVSIITCIILLLFSIKIIKLCLFAMPDCGAKPHWKDSSRHFFLISGMSLLLKQSDILVVGALADASQLALYVVASRLAQLASFALIAVNIVYAPLSAQAYAEGNLSKLESLTRKCSLLILAVSIPVMWGLLYFHDFAFSFFGQEYGEASVILFVLVFSQVINALMGPCGVLLSMTNHEKYVSRVDLVALVINVVLGGGLVLIYGGVGAAVSTFVAVLFRNAVLVGCCINLINVNPTVFSTRGLTS